MPGFRFSETESFQSNWEAFLTEMECLDPAMGSILRANSEKLAAIVQQSNRNSQARSDFNTAIVAALDSLDAPTSGEQQS